jgi:hypothetical protein
MDHRSRRLFTTLLAVLAAATLVMPAGPAAAKKDKDDQPDGMVSEIRDKRIAESSGLALSTQHNDLVYTMNDEGGAGARVYAVRVSTGDVVGAADISGLPIEDPESIAVDAQGTLWLGDLGDNDHRRDDIAIYAFPEPGPGATTISGADRYGVSLPGGPTDVEGMLVHPKTQQVHLISKNEEGTGRIFELPDLTAGGTVQARDLGREAPGAVTDATYTQSGTRALLRTEESIWVYDPETWTAVGKVDTPKMEQGESITVESGDRTVLLGSEGKNSPLVRVALPDPTALTEPIQVDGAGDNADGIPILSRDMAVPVGLAAVALLVAGVIARRRLKI